MATTRTRTAAIRRENGHQVIVLPDDIQFEGDEVLVRQDSNTGSLTVSRLSPRSHWQSVFDSIDSHGPIADEDWEAFQGRIHQSRVSRQDHTVADDSEER